MANVNFHANEIDFRLASPLLFPQPPYYPNVFAFFDRVGPFASKTPFSKLSATISPASPCFLLRSSLLKGLAIIQRVHFHPQGAGNRQIDIMIEMVS